MRKPNIVRLSLSLFALATLLLLAIYTVGLLATARPNVPAKRLVMQGPSPPPGWPFKHWELQKKGPRNLTYGAHENSQVLWEHRESGSAIYQTVFVYGNPAEAEFRYFISQPRLAQWGEYPGFVYPDAPFHSAAADRSQTLCATKNTQNCQIWFYWARYGQYNVEVLFVTPNEGINAKTFIGYLQPIDKHIDAVLAKSGTAPATSSC